MSPLTHRPVKRTYSSKASRHRLALSSEQESSSFPSSETAYESEAERDGDDGGPSKKRKRDDDGSEASDNDEKPTRSLYDSPALPFGKKKRTSSLLLSSGKLKKENKPTPSLKSGPSKTKTKSLTQLHLTFGSSIQNCKSCGLSYTRGSPDDETLHKAHCARIQRGMEWSKEEDKNISVQIIEDSVKLKDGRKGRILCFKPDAKGKLKAKTSTLLQTIDLALSAQALTEATLAESKIYVFLLGQSDSSREKIVGCVVASRIKTAMRVVPGDTQSEDNLSGSGPSGKRDDLVWVDIADGGIFCDPTPLPTIMGIHRIFVSSEHRHQGIACALLSAAARTFIYRCPLDPVKGEIAFSQPTSAGRGVMLSWGKGGVRIFEEK